MEQQRDCGRQKMEEGKGKRRVPTETTREWEGNESLISVCVSHVYVSDQSNVFTHRGSETGWEGVFNRAAEHL